METEGEDPPPRGGGRGERPSGAAGLPRAAVDAGLFLTSMVAAVVAGLTYSNQHVAERSRLHAQVTDFHVISEDGRAICTADYVLFNSGNRDAALLDLSLWTERLDWRSDGFDAEGKLFWQEPGEAGTVIRGGEILLRKVSFPECTAERLFEVLPETNVISLQFTSLDHQGARFVAQLRIGEAPVVGEDWATVNLVLGESVDLLRHGAHYEPRVDMSRLETLTLEQEGETLNFTRTRMASGSYLR